MGKAEGYSISERSGGMSLGRRGGIAVSIESR
jgi:hypothetical protein